MGDPGIEPSPRTPYIEPPPAVGEWGANRVMSRVLPPVNAVRAAIVRPPPLIGGGGYLPPARGRGLSFRSSLLTYSPTGCLPIGRACHCRAVVMSPSAPYVGWRMPLPSRGRGLVERHGCVVYIQRRACDLAVTRYKLTLHLALHVAVPLPVASTTCGHSWFVRGVVACSLRSF